MVENSEKQFFIQKVGGKRSIIEKVLIKVLEMKMKWIKIMKF